MKPAPTTRNEQEPVHSQNLRENSQARFLSTRHNRSEEKLAGEKSERPPTGTKRAKQKKTCKSRPKPPRKGKSRRGQD